MTSWEDSEILKLAIENAYDHIIVTDPDGTIVYANQAVGHVTGYDPQEIIGKNPRLWGGQMAKEFYKKLWRRLKVQKKPFIGEMVNRRKNGEIYFAEVRIAPVLNKSGNVKYLVGIERDITRLKQIEKTKNEIISLTAHQLKSAPATIKIFSDSLIDGIAGKLGKKQIEYIREIQKANKNNIELIDSLLNVTRLELGTFSAKPRVTNLKEACQRIIHSYAPITEQKKLKIKEKYSHGLKNVAVNPESFEIMVHNLISNAIKYTPAQGRVTLELKREVRKKGKGEELSLMIADTGYGIPEEDQSKIFSKMFRSSNIRSISPDGTGLGLYMVKLIIKMLKGKITFESVEGGGTTFHVNFPIYPLKPQE